MSDIQVLAMGATILSVTVFIHGVQIGILMRQIERLEKKK